jgi:predicted O-methyltransferase YrrM
MTKRPSLAKSLTQSVEQAARPHTPPATAAIEAETQPARSPRAEGYRAVTRLGKKKVTAPLDPEAHKLLRMLAIEQSTTVEALLLQAIRDLFAKNGKPSIA